MEHSPITPSLEQAMMVSCEAWEEFFRLVREYAAIARARRRVKHNPDASLDPAGDLPGRNTIS